MRKILFIVFVSAFLFIPCIISFIAHFSPLNFDVKLNGYSDSVDYPEVSKKDVLNGNFQTRFNNWVEQNVKPRGLFTKAYSSVRFSLFNLGNRPIGKNSDIFEWDYINSELCTNGVPDFSIEINRKKMQDFAQKLETLQNLLSKYGKAFYIYITPSKADFHKKNLLDSWVGLSEKNSVKPVDCLTELLDKTNIPHLVCRDLKNQLKYPAFYTTGIHWSRTFEQTVSSKIVSDLRELNGKNYKNIILGDVVESDKPFWRDADVFDLLNTFNKPRERYYEFKIKEANAENYDKMNILIQGTSFGQGFFYDIMMGGGIESDENIFFMNRNLWVLNYRTNEFDHVESFDKFNFSKYLDKVDIVVIELLEAVLPNYAYGFVDYLIDFLPNYKPCDTGVLETAQ